MLALILAGPQAQGQESQKSEGASAPVFNPFDPSAWMGGGQPHSPVQNWYDPSAWMAAGMSPMNLNLAHPEGWAAFVNPYSHTGVHTALMNPATYAQFMQPHFWMQFASPNNWFAWMNPASYSTFLNPATYMGWLNPAAYVHMMNPAMYMQPANPANYMPFLNPATYMSWLNPAAYAIPGTTSGNTGFNPFDPGGWGQYGQPQAENAQGRADATQAQ